MASRAYIENDCGRVYEFGPFRLDEGERSLSRGRERVALTPKVFDTLRLLVQNAGRLVDKDELMKLIWPDSFVEESNLNRSISTLRRALGEAPNEPRYIETVPKRGYRFIAEVIESPGGWGPAAPREHSLSEVVPEAGSEGKHLEPGLGGVQELLASPVDRVEKMSRSVSYRAAAFAGLIVLPIVAIVYFALAIKSDGRDNAARPSTVGSLAVLPFQILGSTEQELGMTDVLITTLSNIREINVRPTSAVLKYGNTEQSLIEIGRGLKVDAILEGSVQKVDDRIRVTVRLMDVNKETPLWAAKFDEPAADILKVQDSIAERVASALSLELTRSSYTQNVKAHDLYVKGRYSFNQRDMQGIEKAQLYFRQAIDEDPSFALAYSGLSDLYTIGGDRGEWGERILQKAIDLDNNLGEAHASKGFRLMFSHWKWDEAERSFKRAIELKPGYAAAYQWYGNLLAITGRLDEAKEMLRRGLEIDPASHNLINDLGQFYYFSRDYDKAIELCQKALEIYPEFSFAYNNLEVIYLKLRRFEECFDVTEKLGSITARNWSNADIKPKTGKEALQTLGGWEKYARDEISRYERKPDPYQSWRTARFYALLGDKNGALDCLEQASQQNFLVFPFFAADPMFDDLHSEPRYQKLLHKVGLVGRLSQ